MLRHPNLITRVATGAALWYALGGGLIFGALAVWDWAHVRGWPVETAEVVSSVRTGETENCGRAGSAEIYLQRWVSQDPPAGLPEKFTDEEGCERSGVGEVHDVIRVVSDTGDVRVWVEPTSSLVWVLFLAGVGSIIGYLVGLLTGVIQLGRSAYRSRDARRARPVGSAILPPSDLEIGSGGFRIRGPRGSVAMDSGGVHLRRATGTDAVTTVAWNDVRRLEINVSWSRPRLLPGVLVNALRTDEGSPATLTIRVRELWRDHTIDLGHSTFSGWPLNVAVTLLLHEVGPKDFERADWTLLTDHELIRWTLLDLPTLIADRPPRGGIGDLTPVEFRVLGNEEAAAELKRRVAAARDRVAAERAGRAGEPPA